MNLDNTLLSKNKNSEILSAYIASDRIRSNIIENRNRAKELAQKINQADPEIILLIGSGASYCTLYTGYQFLKTSTDIQVIHNFGPEFCSSNPELLKEKKVFAILSSYSGKTKDTLEACNILNRMGIPKIALSSSSDSELSKKCDFSIAYNDTCLYTSAMTNLLMLLAEYAIIKGFKEKAESLLSSLKKLPDQIAGIISMSEKKAAEMLEGVKDEEFFYVMGDGSLWALAYQYGYTNLMEYSRIHSACLRGCEWRHGPLEILFRKPAIIFFIGNDDSRKYTIAARDYCIRNGGRVVSFDVKDYFETDPVLAPFVLHTISQLFLLYQSTYKGIDMDEYLEMHIKPFTENETYF